MSNIIANWDAPFNVLTATTTRNVGQSLGEFASNNLGLHVGDNQESVLHNRKALKQNLNPTRDPVWLNQTHSNICIRVNSESSESKDTQNADATITNCKELPLAIMTADCLPILLCNRDGTEIAAIHGGWRGLANGIIENTVKMFTDNPKNYIAWIGPAICGNCYATGDEVYQEFTNKYPDTVAAFKKNDSKIYANLAMIAEMILTNMQISKVFQSNICTYEESNRFYSYRKSAKTGRIASLIWFKE